VHNTLRHTVHSFSLDNDLIEDAITGESSVIIQLLIRSKCAE